MSKLLKHFDPGARVVVFLLVTAWLPLGCSETADGLLRGSTPPVSAAPPRAPDGVSALGRLSPEHGVMRVAGPSGPASVIQELLVKEGDWVTQGQVIARLDTVDLLKADISRLVAEHANARRDQKRNSQLYNDKVVSDAQRDGWETRVVVARSSLRRARAELARALVKAPIEGRVLAVHAYAGEIVGPNGIIELGRTDRMFAIAEVYEEDVGRLAVGQRATVRSPVFPRPLKGTVDWIHLRVAKQDALGTDPAARKDARVIEVEIRLDESDVAGRLTNLQVEIEIEP